MCRTSLTFWESYLGVGKHNGEVRRCLYKLWQWGMWAIWHWTTQHGLWIMLQSMHRQSDGTMICGYQPHDMWLSASRYSGPFNRVFQWDLSHVEYEKQLLVQRITWCVVLYTCGIVTAYVGSTQSSQLM